MRVRSARRILSKLYIEHCWLLSSTTGLRFERLHDPDHGPPAYGTLGHRFPAADACAHVATFEHHAVHRFVHADLAQVFIFQASPAAAAVGSHRGGAGPSRLVDGLRRHGLLFHVGPLISDFALVVTLPRCPPWARRWRPGGSSDAVPALIPLAPVATSAAVSIGATITPIAVITAASPFSVQLSVIAVVSIAIATIAIATIAIAAVATPGLANISWTIAESAQVAPVRPGAAPSTALFAHPDVVQVQTSVRFRYREFL